MEILFFKSYEMKTLNSRLKFTNGTRALFYVSGSYICDDLKDILQLLLDHTIIDLNTRSHFGGSANKIIFKELMYNNLLRSDLNELANIIRVLKNFGFNINEQESDGWNAPLHFILYYQRFNSENSSAIIRLLIESGINVNAKTKDGDNALQVLFTFGKTHDALDFTKILIENGMDVNLKNGNGDNTLLSLLKLYSGENMIEITRMIIENGIDINSKSKEGRNALHYLLMSYHDPDVAIEILKMLLEAGIRINAIEAKNGCNGLFFLTIFHGGSHLQGQNVIMAKMLIDKGINVNARNKSGHTVLHYLLSMNSMNTNLEMIELLLSHNGTV